MLRLKTPRLRHVPESDNDVAFATDVNVQVRLIAARLVRSFAKPVPSRLPCSEARYSASPAKEGAQSERPAIARGIVRKRMRVSPDGIGHNERAAKTFLLLACRF